MKKLVTSLTAIAAVVGVGTAALAFTPKPFVSHTVFATIGDGVNWSYANSQPNLPLSCKSSTATTACSFTSTATALFFNQHNATTFPTNGQTSPKVDFIDAGIYR